MGGRLHDGFTPSMVNTMLSYRWTYLLMGLGFATVWFALFMWRKNTRREMVVTSLLVAALAPLSDLIYTIDWWHPETLTGTRIGIEAVFTGFFMGGVMAVLYEDLFHKRIRLARLSRQERHSRDIEMLALIGVATIIFFGTYIFLDWNSFQSSIASFMFVLLTIIIIRPDLTVDALASSVMLFIVAVLVYTTLELLTPGWVMQFWVFENVPEIIILNVPIDDVVFYLIAGGMMGPLYAYWKEGTIIADNE